MPGDRQRRINWPATTRRGSLQLNTFAAERTQNVVVIADATSDVGEPGYHPWTWCCAARPARAALPGGRDRVGLIGYRDQVSWIAPGRGPAAVSPDHGPCCRAPAAGAGGTLTWLPRAALPPGALIIVFSPLLDRRLIEALRDLRERGSPCWWSMCSMPCRTAVTDRVPGLARRIWRMEQQAIRFSLRELGIPVVHWDGQQSLDEPLAPYTSRVMVMRR